MKISANIRISYPKTFVKVVGKIRGRLEGVKVKVKVGRCRCGKTGGAKVRWLVK